LSIWEWYNTTKHVHSYFPIAENREQWKLLPPKLKWTTSPGITAADV